MNPEQKAKIEAEYNEKYPHIEKCASLKSDIAPCSDYCGHDEYLSFLFSTIDTVLKEKPTEQINHTKDLELAIRKLSSICDMTPINEVLELLK